MKASPKPRKTANLSESIHQQLNMYAIAAGAAGVGMLALAQPTAAKIVYTPANVKIPPNTALPLDLNHDGLPDFWLVDSSFATSATHVRLSVQPKNLNKVWDGARACQSGYVCPLALRKGRVIGENSHFKSGPAYMVDINAAYQFGPWWMPKNSEVQAYLGLSFFVKGQFHFGWARVKVQADQKYVVIAATLTGYAYETIPNKPIIAGATKGPDDAEPTESFNTPTPEPSTLGMLALGAPGLSIWRRKESADEGE